MSATVSPQIDEFINRGVAMLQADTQLFPSGYPPNAGDNLVTDVLAQQPPIEQSPNTSLMPIIFVGYPRNPIRRVEYRGRDTIDAAGARLYFLEFYNVIIVNELTPEESQALCQQISTIVRDVYQKNLRMKDPAAPTNFLSITNEVTSVPFVVRSNSKTVKAVNVICRPQQIVSLR